MHRYLTRSDIAEILNVSLRRAGQLMFEMPALQISKRQRRVTAEDFEAWCEAKSVRSSNALMPTIKSKQLPSRREPLARSGPLKEAAMRSTRKRATE